MTTPAQLRKQALLFVGTLSSALNRSVSDGIRLQYVGSVDGRIGSIAYKASKENLPGEPFPLGVTKQDPVAHLYAGLVVTLEPEQEFLKVIRATFALYADPDDKALFHYDFDREKEVYPSAHLQVHGGSRILEELDRRQGTERQLERLHFPVGGTRFRPCLEDVIEFLIVEGFVTDPRPGWQEALEESRNEFRRIQLKAAVRRDPDAAIEQLESMGYAIDRPE